MKPSLYKRYHIVGQIAAWIILFLIHFIEVVGYLGIIPSFVYSLAIIMLLMGAAYFHYYLLLPLFNKGKNVLYFPGTLLLVLVTSFLMSTVAKYTINEVLGATNFWGSMVYDSLLIVIIGGALSLLYFVEAWYNNLQRESLLKNEKLEAELNFLKSQINPHFLFNTLNNIYSYAQTGNIKTAPMLERLSSILRFMVYDCSEDRVQLNKEISAVEDLLEIHKMKNSAQKNIQLNVEGVKGFHLIAPLIIVNFVENACKHSDVISNEKGYIKVNIQVDANDQCLLEIANSVKKRTIPVRSTRD